MMYDTAGQVVGDYRLETPLAPRTAASAWLARHTRLDRLATLLLTTTAGTPDLVQVLALLRPVALLDHPQLVALLDAGSSNGQVYLVEALFATQTLSDQLQQASASGQPLPLPTVLNLLVQASDGLAFAHTAGLAHGALTPELLQLHTHASDYQLKVAGLALAQLAASHEVAQIAQTALAYRAPEQLRGEAPTPASDVYALGCMLYELLTGTAPFAAATRAATIETQLIRHPLAPSQVRPALPSELDLIVLRALAKTPAERPTAAEFATALRQAAGLRGTAATPQLGAAAPQQPPTAERATLTAPPGYPATLRQALATTPFELQLLDEHLALSPGQPALVRLHVTNRTNRVAHLQISVEGVPNDWLRQPAQPALLNPGESTMIGLTVLVPRLADSAAEDFPVTIYARSVTSPAEVGSARGRWTVLPFSAISLALAPRRTSGQRGAAYQVLLRNDGNTPALVTLSAEDDEHALGYYFEHDQLALEQGEAGVVALRVAAPPRWLGNRRARRFSVRAEATHAVPQTIEGQFVHQALVPLWLPPLAVALALVLWVLLGNLLPRIDTGIAPTAMPTATTPVETSATTSTASAIPATAVATATLMGATVAASTPPTLTVRATASPQTIPTTTPRTPTATPARTSATAAVSPALTVIIGVTASPQPTNSSATPATTPTSAPTALRTPSATATPTQAQASATATASPTTTPTPGPSPVATLAPINLSAQASSATWRTGDGIINFGDPGNARDLGGWVNLVNNITLEDGGSYSSLIYTVPPISNGAYIEGVYGLRDIQPGEHFLARFGFTQGAPALAVAVQVSINNDAIFTATKQVNGSLSAIDIDLERFVGQSGKLVLRVEGIGSSRQGGVYWVEPRVAVP